MFGAEQSSTWLVLIFLAVFIAVETVSGYMLVSYELEARRVRQNGQFATGWELIWTDLTTTAE